MEMFFRDRPVERMLHHKALLREAARLAREDLLTDGASSQAGRGGGAEREVLRRELRFKSAARALWRSDSWLRRRLAVWPHGAEYFCFRDGDLAEATLHWFGQRMAAASRGMHTCTCTAREADKKRKAGAKGVAEISRPSGARMKFSVVILEAAIEEAARVTDFEPDMF